MLLRDLHQSDFSLVERCLEHEAEALAFLRRTYRGSVSAYLIKAGASAVEAQETVEMLWGDLLSPASTGRIRLSRYNGGCALLTWLNTVALNALLTRKRMDARRTKRFVPEEAGNHAEPVEEVATTEEPLIELIREAVEFSFQNCRAEDFVLLQLEYCDQLERGELARMFGCSKSTVSRMLETARVAVAENTMSHVHRRDPWLELRWEDFLELSRTATLSCLGLEN